MWRALVAASNRTLTQIALGCLAVMAGTQAAVFGIWGNDGDPPAAAVVLVFVLFWGAVLLLLAVAFIGFRRRREPPRA